MTTKELFQELETQPGLSGEYGTLERRIPSSSGCDLFVGVHKPGNAHSFRARFAASNITTSSPLPHFKGLEVNQYSTLEDDVNYLTIKLHVTGSAFNDVFTSLVEDAAGHIADISDPNEAAVSFINRLVKWQRFLERYRPEGLGPEEQRGLFGELWFLSKYAFSALPLEDAIRAWTGPEKLAKDFQIAGCAVEVKTTASKQHQVIHISSELQLDDTGLSALYLFHLSLELSQAGGQTLPELVHHTRLLVSSCIAAAAVFEDKLRDAGYLDIHEDQYLDSKYIIHACRVFRVQTDFPRIIAAGLQAGIGDVRYSISVAECVHFAVAEEDLKSALGGFNE